MMFINRMKVLRVLVVVLGLVIFGFSANATYTYGCVSDDTGYIYPNEYGNGTYESSPVRYFGSGDYCKASYVSTCRIRSRVDCRDCTGPFNEGSKKNPDWWYYQSGREYRYLPCPIDSETGVLLMSSLTIGIFFIRRKNN